MTSPEPGRPESSGAGRDIRAARVLRVRTVWVTPIAVAVVLVFLMTLFYVGSVVSPVSHLSGLPVGLVDEDNGATVAGQRIDIGAEIASALRSSSAVSRRLSLATGSLHQAENVMNRDGAYATIVIPPDLTASLLSAYGLEAGANGKPTVQLLANPRAGSIGVELATGVAQPALHSASAHVGQELTAEASQLHRTPSAAISPADPLTVATTEFRSLPSNSALGLSAFYVSLLSIMCGFLGAVLVNSTVDAALGYGMTEIGPRWSQRMPVAITRSQTLIAKWVVALLTVPILTGVLLLVAVGVLGMDAPTGGLLWGFISFAAVAIAAGTLALFAAFGTLGQLVAMLLFVYLALASSGGTIPLQALPGPLRFVANFEPLRQVLDAVRSILYFGGAGDAGLTRGVVLTAAGLVFWLVAGFLVTKWYDRRGLDRLAPDVLEFVQRSAESYEAQRNPTVGES